MLLIGGGKLGSLIKNSRERKAEGRKGGNMEDMPRAQEKGEGKERTERGDRQCEKEKEETGRGSWRG